MTRANNFVAQARIIDGKVGAIGRHPSDDEIRSFRSNYGARPEVCLALYRMLRRVDCRPTVEHLLWALAFLKQYSTEDVFAKKFKTTRKTFRNHIWPIVRKISALCNTVIQWENRHRGAGRPKTCRVTVDGTDCRIYEPKPFNRKWYSHKFKKAGLRYEVAVCIKTGDIVWVNGPFPCGRYPDIKIFRRALKQMLGLGEMVEADLGYRGEPNYVRTPQNYVSRSDRRAKKNARARHETVNKRLKDFTCLSKVFRHDRTLHCSCFRAAAVITQLSFENGDRPWQVLY